MPGPNSDHSGSRAARKQRTRERIAAAAAVPGFPEIVRLNGQCRLCLLVKDDADLLRVIHDLYHPGGRGFVALEGDTLEYWQKRNETPLNHRSFARHFRNHVAFQMTVPAATAVLPERPALPEPNPETGDYFDMRSIIDRLRARLNDVDERASFIGQDGRVDNYAIVMWLRLVAEFRAALEAMNRMKNGDRLTKAIIQAHAKRNAQMTSALLVPRFQTLLHDLRLDPEGGVDALEHFFAEEVTGLIVQAADESVKESCEAYRLH